LLALAQGDRLAPHQLREARALLRRLLEPHLGGRPLKSRELFRRFAVAPAPNPVPGSGQGPFTSRDSTQVGITNRSLES
jgi:DNA repair protein RecO (recombination protein O)